MAEIIASLVRMEGCDINQMNCGGLVWAGRNGHEQMVRMLLGLDGVNPDKPDNYGGTQLCWATSNGHKGVVEILLGRAWSTPTN